MYAFGRSAPLAACTICCPTTSARHPGCLSTHGILRYLHCTVLYCTMALYCTVLYHTTALYCTAEMCNIQFKYSKDLCDVS